MLKFPGVLLIAVSYAKNHCKVVVFRMLMSDLFCKVELLYVFRTMGKGFHVMKDNWVFETVLTKHLTYLYLERPDSFPGFEPIKSRADSATPILTEFLLGGNVWKNSCQPPQPPTFYHKHNFRVHRFNMRVPHVDKTLFRVSLGTSKSALLLMCRTLYP